MNMIPPLIASPLVRPAWVEDDDHYEIEDGIRMELAPMSTFAGWIAGRLLEQMILWKQSHDVGIFLSEELFRLPLTPERQRRPDIAFLSYQRWPKEREPDENAAAWDVAPDLAVEVVSPSDQAEPLQKKIQEYFQAGVRMVWVIYPRRRWVLVYESPRIIRGLLRTDELDGGDVLPGFRLPLSVLFPGEPATGSPQPV